MITRQTTAIPVLAAILLGTHAVARATTTDYALPTAHLSPIESLNDPIRHGHAAIITLDNADTLKGRVLATHESRVQLEHPVLGSISIPVERIAGVQWLDAAVSLAPPSPVEQIGPPADINPDATRIILAQTPPADASTPAPPQPTRTPDWGRQLELGLSGSSGNTDRTTLRTGFKGRWSRDNQTFSLDTLYLFNVTDGNRTQNRFDLTVRNEWLATPTPWRYFAEGGVELDEFRDYDSRIRAGAGVGYKLLQTDRTDLLTRLGAGVSRTFGSPDDVTSPELILGAEFSHKLTGRQRLVAGADVFPNLADNDTELRAVLNAAWELKIDQAQNLTLRLGVQDRYDSDTQEARRNDLEYLASLVWSF